MVADQKMHITDQYDTNWYNHYVKFIKLAQQVNYIKVRQAFFLSHYIQDTDSLGYCLPYWRDNDLFVKDKV